MGLDIIAQIVTTKEALIALIIMTCIASVAIGLIGGLISKTGSLKNLMSICNNPTDKTSKKGSPTTNDIKD